MMIDDIKKQFNVNIELHKKSVDVLSPKIAEAASMIIQAYKNGNKVLLCGNGGSAADAQHITGELVGRFKKERRALPAIALTTDSSIMTALANDYWYDLLFSRQVEALGNKDDILIAISTSGNSKNIIRAVETAKSKEMKTIGFLGGDGGVLKDLVDLSLVVDYNESDRVQEVHIFIAHVICDLIDKSF